MDQLPEIWLEDLSEAVLLVEQGSAQILYGNPAAHVMLGAEPASLAGKVLTQLIPVDLTQAEGRSFLLQGPLGRRAMEYRVRPLGNDQLRVYLHDAQTCFDNLANQILTGVMVLSQGSIIFANQEISRMLGVPNKDLLGVAFESFIQEKDLEKVRERLSENPREFELEIKTGRNRTLPVEIAIKQAEMLGRPCQCLTLRNITKQRVAEAQREEYHKHLQQNLDYSTNLFERLPLGAWVLDWTPLIQEPEGDSRTESYHKRVGVKIKIKRTNQALQIMLGHDRSEMEGRSIFDPMFVDDANAEIFIQEVNERRKGKRGSYEVTLRHKSGREIPVLLESIPIIVDEEQGLALQSISIMVDLTERKRWEAELKRLNQKLRDLSATDALTDLANRRTFDDYLVRQWEKAQLDHSELALIFIDIDFFKAYNDNYGHLEGDACLAKMASIFKGCFRRGADMVARYGGEEFAVILPDTPVLHAKELAEELRKAVESYRIPHLFSQAANHITISLGVASMKPGEVIDHKDLIHKADQALYQSKHQGRNRATMWQED